MVRSVTPRRRFRPGPRRSAGDGQQEVETGRVDGIGAGPHIELHGVASGRRAAPVSTTAIRPSPATGAMASSTPALSS